MHTTPHSRHADADHRDAKEAEEIIGRHRALAGGSHYEGRHGVWRRDVV